MQMKDSYIEVEHRVGGGSIDVINFIDNNYPFLKGKCKYNREEKELYSTDKDCSFYYDPFHQVLSITYRK